MSWISILQDRVSSLFSNITFVLTDDEKRIRELENMLLIAQTPLNILHGSPIKSIYLYDGVSLRKAEVKDKDIRYTEIDIDEFSSPLKDFILNNDENTVFIIHNIIKMETAEQQVLLSYAHRDEYLLAKNKHIIVFIDNTAGINEKLLDNVNTVEVPISLESERLAIITDFQNKMKETVGINDIFSDIPSVIRATSGLNLRQFEGLLYEGFVSYRIKKKETVPASWFAQKKVELLNRSGIFNLMNPTHGIDAFASPLVIKEYISKRIINVIKNYEKAKEIGVGYPDGLLLFGMQGTGKTWLARAIANEINVPFMEFNVASIMSKYVGDTEKNVEKMIRILEAIQPAVLFIDEIDAIAMKRTGIDLDSGVSRKMINRLMSWLSEEREVLVIGSTNKPEQLDEAFIRSGRFSHKIPLLLPNFETRIGIFQIHVNMRHPHAEEIDFPELARKTQYFSGADIVKVVDDALFYVFDKGKDRLTMEEFDEAMNNIVINIEENKEQQKQYVSLAKRFGTDRKIIEVYTTGFDKVRESDKITMLKNYIKGGE